MYAPPPRPRNVTEWYADAIAVLERCRDRVEGSGQPVDGGPLLEAVRLSKQLVELDP